jgi:ABC-type uncharacterized transport system involved in gliding motility auxiliary subunit
MNKILNYLFFWIGPMLMIMGFTAQLIIGKWEIITLSLLISGFLIFTIWLFIFSKKQKELLGKYSTQTLINSLISTLSILLIFALINFLAVRYSTRIDITENQILTLAPQTQTLLKNLSQPVKVWVFEINNPPLESLLIKYQTSSNKFTYQFIDPLREPNTAESFQVKRLGEVYLEYNKKRQLLQTLNENETLSEIKLTTGIEKIISDRTDKIYFLQGHGESSLETDFSQAVNILKEKNYQPETLNLVTTNTIPKDTKILIISRAKKTLLPTEVKTIQTYLKTGGSLLLMTDYPSNTGLETLLKDWGVIIDKRLVVTENPKLEGLAETVTVITNYGDHPITKDFKDKYSFYPLAVSIDLQEIKDIEAKPLLLTDEKTFATAKSEEKKLQFNQKKDKPGPLILGVALKRNYPSNNEQKSLESRLVVLGNSAFATNNLFDQQINGDVFLNSVTWLGENEQQVLSIRPKEPKNRRINMSPLQINLLGLIAIVIVPMIAFSMAIILWWKMR